MPIPSPLFWPLDYGANRASQRNVSQDSWKLGINLAINIGMTLC